MRRLFAALLFAVPATARAQPASDPAVVTVNALDTALISAMRQGESFAARSRRLQPAVEAAFDLPAMTRFAVGPRWGEFAAADQTALIRAFGRFSIATYAHNFDAWSGERFTVEAGVQTREPDKLVRSALLSKSGAPTRFIYRLRQSGGVWKIVDVFFNGTISELASQRSDFQSTLDQGGAGALIKKLDDKAEALAR